MGFETMRRWPVFVIFAFCLLLCLSLLNSWSTQSLLETKLHESTVQLQMCSKKQASCLLETMDMTQLRDNNAKTINNLEKEKEELKDKINTAIKKALEKDNLANRTQVDVELCRTELQSLQNLQLTKSATLDTLRLEKDQLNEELSNKKEEIEKLQKEIASLKIINEVRTPANPPLAKITPAGVRNKPSYVIGAPINQPEVVANDNNAKEEDEEINANNDGFNDFNDAPSK